MPTTHSSDITASKHSPAPDGKSPLPTALPDFPPPTTTDPPPIKPAAKKP